MQSVQISIQQLFTHADDLLSSFCSLSQHSYLLFIHGRDFLSLFLSLIQTH